jgi:hypothetical protein
LIIDWDSLLTYRDVRVVLFENLLADAVGVMRAVMPLSTGAFFYCVAIVSVTGCPDFD